MSGFKKAQRSAKKIKMAIQGPSGAGKTFSALKIATALNARTDPGKQIAVIDTEKSAEMYAPPFVFEHDDDFGEGPKLSYHPDRLIEKLEAARKDGRFGVVIVDSMSHFWDGAGGFLAMHADIGARQKARGQKEDTWGNWKHIDPAYDALWTYIRNYPLHLILCFRSEEKTEKNGDGKVEKVGLQAIFRKKWEFEVDIQFAIVDQGSSMMPWKHRLGAFLKDKIFKSPGDNVAEAIVEWMSAGAPEVLPVEKTADKPEEAKKPAPAPAPAKQKEPPVARSSKPTKTEAKAATEKAAVQEAAKQEFTNGAPPVAQDPADEKAGYTLSNEAQQAQIDKAVATCVPDELTVAQKLKKKMLESPLPADLQAAAKEAGDAKKEGLINVDEYKDLTKAYKTADARHKAAAAPAATGEAAAT